MEGHKIKIQLRKLKNKLETWGHEKKQTEMKTKRENDCQVKSIGKLHSLFTLLYFYFVCVFEQHIQHNIDIPTKFL